MKINKIIYNTSKFITYKMQVIINSLWVDETDEDTERPRSLIAISKRKNKCEVFTVVIQFIFHQTLF